MTETQLRALVREAIDTIGLSRTARLLELSTEATLKVGGGFKTRGPTITHATAYAPRLTEAMRQTA